MQHTGSWPVLTPWLQAVSLFCQMSKNSDNHVSTVAAAPWNMRDLQHLQAVTLVDVQCCHADTLAAALPRVPLDRLTLD